VAQLEEAGAQVVARGPGSRLTRLTGLGAVGIALIVSLAGCSVGDTFAGFGWPKGVSPQARQMYDLWIGAVVAALAVGVFVWGLIFWCVVRYRKRGEELPPQTRFNMPMEFLYTVLPFLAIAVLFYYTAIIQTDVDKRTANPDVTVEVVAYKWNWKFRHVQVRGADGQATKPVGPDGQPITTVGASDYIPVLVLPVNKRIRFVEHSEDVIHSFWVPDLLFKRDVFPGSITNEFEVTIDREGAYVGRCAELCGAYHSMMNFEVRVVSQAEFDRYLQERRQGRSTPEALKAIGEPEYAVKTKPFGTEPEQQVRAGAK
jgi:cytochrome c oxidase subunit II